MCVWVCGCLPSVSPVSLSVQLLGEQGGSSRTDDVTEGGDGLTQIVPLCLWSFCLLMKKLHNKHHQSAQVERAREARQHAAALSARSACNLSTFRFVSNSMACTTSCDSHEVQQSYLQLFIEASVSLQADLRAAVMIQSLRCFHCF